MRILPTVKINRNIYFMDERLKQFRSVADVFESIDFNEFEKLGHGLTSLCCHERFTAETGCPDCHFHDVLATKVEEE
jgi:hypothetical protein